MQARYHGILLIIVMRKLSLRWFGDMAKGTKGSALSQDPNHGLDATLWPPGHWEPVTPRHSSSSMKTLWKLNCHWIKASTWFSPGQYRERKRWSRHFNLILDSHHFSIFSSTSRGYYLLHLSQAEVSSTRRGTMHSSILYNFFTPSFLKMFINTHKKWLILNMKLHYFSHLFRNYHISSNSFLSMYSTNSCCPVIIRLEMN